MKLGTGSHELTRLASAYVTAIAFGVTAAEENHA
jgi:hypothetical protein